MEVIEGLASHLMLSCHTDPPTCALSYEVHVLQQTQKRKPQMINAETLVLVSAKKANLRSHGSLGQR